MADDDDSSENNVTLLLGAAAAAIIVVQRRRRRRQRLRGRVWSRDWLIQRHTERGMASFVLNELIPDAGGLISLLSADDAGSVSSATRACRATDRKS